MRKKKTQLTLITTEENASEEFKQNNNSNNTSNNTDSNMYNVTGRPLAFSYNSSYNNLPAHSGFDINIPAIENNVMTDSVASILAACYGLDHWRGFEQQEQQLVHIGKFKSIIV